MNILYFTKQGGAGDEHTFEDKCRFSAFPPVQV